MPTPDKTPEWKTAGFNHIWLPYTQMQTVPLPLPVISANGVQITLADGRELIDGIASWWCTCHGYQHPHLIKQISRQLDTLSHVMFAGLAHEPAYTLARRLVSITPQGLNRVFFSDSGSIAVEVAMKMAAQYWSNRQEPDKRKFICFRNGYHGDTMGGMSLADPETGMHRALNHYMPEQYVFDIPNNRTDLAALADSLQEIKETVAGLVIEPLVQAAGGMKFHPPEMLAEIHKLCEEHRILFIADEIATGFGRTGSMFACLEAGITPDIMCLGKALTGGMVGLAATLATEEVFEGFLSDRLETALMHGPTFMANPLACTAANASLDLFEGELRIAQIQAIETQLQEELKPCRKLKNVADVRVKGAIGVVQLSNTNGEYILALRQRFIEEGVWLRPFSDVVYIMPAFIISTAELSRLTDAVFKILAAQLTSPHYNA